MNSSDPIEQKPSVPPLVSPHQWRTGTTYVPRAPKVKEAKVDKVQLIAGIALMVALFSWGIILVDRVVMPLVAYQGVEVEMPNLYHLPINRADSLAGSLGLEIRRAGIRVDDHIPPGFVVDQAPAHGLMVKQGRIVDAVLSVKPERIHCPNLMGLSARDAKLIADSAGLRIPDNMMNYSFYPGYPAGTVVKQSPKAMQSMVKGDQIAVTISLGGEPSVTTVPSLIGQKISEIKFLLLQNRVQIGKIENVVDPNYPANTIVSQEPLAGTSLEPNSKINVKVAIQKK